MFGYVSSAYDLVTCSGSPDICRTINEGSPEIMKSACNEEIEPRMDISFEKDIYDCKIISASPDLIMCDTSPNIPQKCTDRSYELLKSACEDDIGENVEISFEKCCDDECESPEVKAEPQWPEPNKKGSFELLPQPQNDDSIHQNHPSILHLNSGLVSGDMISFDGAYFVNDDLFEGGDTLKTDVVFGDGECWSLFQTARYGNFSYKFQFLEAGIYIVDLYFAEIVYTSSAMRVFNIFIQDEMVRTHTYSFDR